MQVREAYGCHFVLLQKLLENLERHFDLEKSHAMLQDRHGIPVPLMADKVLTALNMQLSRISDVGYPQVAFYGPVGTRPLTCSVGTGTEVVGGWRQVTHENPSRLK